MSTSERIPIAPNVLQWARESAGLSSEIAAKRLAVTGATLAAWETGDQAPTVKQLRTAAKAYKRPLAVLLLPAPPKDFDAIRDFRRATGALQREWSAELHSEFKRAVSQRDVFLEIDELAPGSIQHPERPLSFTKDTAPEEAGKAIRQALGIDLAKQSWSNPRDALNAWITSCEAFGILIMQTQGIAISETKGFSISEWPHPIIALNGADWPRSRLFTLAHELSHLGISASGLCDLHESENRRSPSDSIEHYCNRVGASILMPADLVLANPIILNANKSKQWTLEDLTALSRRFGTSSEAFLLRLITLERANFELYRLRKPELDREYEEARKREKERQHENKGGPSYYVIKARNLGYGYITTVLDAYWTHAISSLDVADYLNIRFDQLPKLEKAVLR